MRSLTYVRDCKSDKLQYKCYIELALNMALCGFAFSVLQCRCNACCSDTKTGASMHACACKIYKVCCLLVVARYNLYGYFVVDAAAQLHGAHVGVVCNLQ